MSCLSPQATQDHSLHPGLKTGAAQRLRACGGWGVFLHWALHCEDGLVTDPESLPWPWPCPLAGGALLPSLSPGFSFF